MNVIPAIDLRGGRCVRLFQGDFSRETHYSDAPQEIARRYESMACTNLHLVDLDGAESGVQRNRDLVREITATSKLDVQLGGGIRDRESVKEWLAAGVSRVVIGSCAITEPQRVIEWIEEFSADRFVLAFDCRTDVRGVPWIATHGWTRLSKTALWDSVESYFACGIRRVLCTDISRDGALTGPSLPLYEELVSRFPDLFLQASGGVRNLQDLEDLRRVGAAAAITGRALLDGSLSPAEVESFQRNA
ncbi:MAG: 1-(5-phosphoribosyl)-5-[(5-phosphoribosylamino)methylideneamino]imidazole-4-carboxamide isomerase [Woeseia sp.]|nr:1-(5-phosphoribosyl)-5-[(5-phosphoribosylamino)methylideneamino]imidazole-4-carboxamide isomerase [Woeseia sp.]MBT8097447.1 1-(5-phosphoribosyl)-5-[(5-phosphoribosylamino)methylideneamino]imidazole-4-carboxamide isomerase [Woeseia sp.]NNE59423.1 1-(5-phosphoribosyl)-5-[(5-phosphoribosylamino)methylideneamino]imidazole-4-carboxamide isomerase [Woeseia sp.]NNL53531.1 1-(5-phosphoribosyl)-5-[(5-phosphoribosylamino)methylideneamino]imidazole-4-carboxamide isomerase [Woeseia sp.]